MNLTELRDECYRIAVEHGWTHDNVPGEICLMHSELSEALEAYRLPDRPVNETWTENGKPEGVPTELADTIIRILDFCGAYNIDIECAVQNKMAYNRTRPYRHGGKKL